MASDADLKLEAVTKYFGKVTALDSINLVVRHGELLTILGPSGSGKTTLLRIVAGFESPDGGAVVLKGQDITYASPASRDIGMVFQNYALFPHMTVAQNVAFPLEMRKIEKPEIEKRVAWALGVGELKGFEERFPRQLSGGQQQRVALARAIVFDPQILLLDEPFGALDRKLREQVQLEVRRLQQQLKLTALFVTHDQEEALILSDRIAVMSDGRIEQLGTPHEIYAKPANRFVADFIGESNLLEGQIESQNVDGLSVRTADGTLLRVTTESSLAANENVVILVRPEHIHLVAQGGSSANRMDGVVKEIVYLGQSEKIRVTLDTGFEVLMRRHTETTNQPMAVGEKVSVCWSPSDGHLIKDEGASKS